MCNAPVRLRWHGAIDDRDVHAGLLPHLAILDHAGNATTAICAGPGILAKWCAVNFLNLLADGVLGVADDLLEARFSAVWAIGAVCQTIGI